MSVFAPRYRTNDRAAGCEQELVLEAALALRVSEQGDPLAWGEIFGDDAVAVAMIDRLVHHAEILSQAWVSTDPSMLPANRCPTNQLWTCSLRQRSVTASDWLGLASDLAPHCLRNANVRCNDSSGATMKNGFGLYRASIEAGIDAQVIAPGKTPRGPSDRVKTDRNDAERLARQLLAGSLTAVVVPSAEVEAAREMKALA